MEDQDCVEGPGLQGVPGLRGGTSTAGRTRTALRDQDSGEGPGLLGGPGLRGGTRTVGRDQDCWEGPVKPWAPCPSLRKGAAWGWVWPGPPT